jgi:two-component system, cell cycle response regulator CpdR
MARILLCDDEPSTRDLVRRALELDGHAVTVMASGTDALDALTLQPAGFDVLISDVQMPGLDGIALAAKAAVLCPGLRLILMSGFVEQLERAKGLGVHRLAVVTKPFALDKMRATVHEVLS